MLSHSLLLNFKQTSTPAKHIEGLPHIFY